MENDNTCLDYAPAFTLISRLSLEGQGEAGRVDDDGLASDQDMEMSAAMMNRLRMILATTAFCWDPAGE